MNVLKLLHREKKKLLLSQEKIKDQIHGIQAAILALNGTAKHRRRRGKMSAAHRKAIRLGIARAKAGK